MGLASHGVEIVVQNCWASHSRGSFVLVQVRPAGVPAFAAATQAGRGCSEHDRAASSKAGGGKQQGSLAAGAKQQQSEGLLQAAEEPSSRPETSKTQQVI